MKKGRASNTAKVIAASTILLASDRRTSSLVSPAAADLCKVFLSESRFDRWLAKSAAWPPTRMLWRSLESLTHPGIMKHYWYRKHWIESRVEIAIERGLKRLIILGAGFDTLGFRLSAVIPETEIVEVDHPATQGAKLRALEKNSIRIPSNLKFLGLDLSRQSFPPEFAKGSDSTLFVIEGLLMYLEPEIVNRLFESLRKLPAQHVRVLFSFMTEWPGGGIGFQPSSWLINQWLDWHKEPFSWGLKPQAINDFLVSHGFVMRELFSSHKLAEEYGLDSVDLEGENMVSCETG